MGRGHTNIHTHTHVYNERAGYTLYRYGRKLAVLVASVAGGVLGLMKSFSRSYWTYIALETVEAAAGDPQSAVFTLVLELADKTDVGCYQTVLLSFYTGGLILLPLIAWLVRGWRTLLRVLYTPALLALLGTTLLRDSPRWLLAAGRGREAVLELRRAACTNRVELDDRELSALQATPPPPRSSSGGAVLSATLRSSALRLRLAVCLAWWTTITLINYGMMIGSAHVTGAGDRFSNFALLMLMDVPANLSAGVALRRVGRRRALLVSFVLGGVCCLVLAGAGEGAGGAGVARLVLFLVFETLATFSYNIVYVYTSELFPTRARNTIHATCAIAGRLGALLAPQTPLLLHYWAGLPAALFGTLSLMSGALVPLMPETSHISLPDTPHDAEHMTTPLAAAQPTTQPTQPTHLTLLTEQLDDT